jgi:hypothetical protein
MGKSNDIAAIISATEKIATEVVTALESLWDNQSLMMILGSNTPADCAKLAQALRKVKTALDDSDIFTAYDKLADIVGMERVTPKRVINRRTNAEIEAAKATATIATPTAE